MSTIDEVRTSNVAYAAAFAGPAAAAPARQLVVVACMDARLELLPALGLEVGDAHVIRNAGGVVTDDVIRSVSISQRLLGTREVMLVHHTGCGLLGLDDDEFRSALYADTGQRPAWSTQAFADLDEDVQRSIARIKASPFVPHTGSVRGFVFDVGTGALREVEPAR